MSNPHDQKQLNTLVNQALTNMERAATDPKVTLSVMRKRTVQGYLDHALKEGIIFNVHSQPKMEMYGVEYPFNTKIEVVKHAEPKEGLRYTISSLTLPLLEPLNHDDIVDGLQTIVNFSNDLLTPQPELLKISAGNLEQGLPKRIITNEWAVWHRKTHGDKDYDGDMEHYEAGGHEAIKRLFPEEDPSNVEVKLVNLPNEEGVEVKFFRVARTQI